MSNIPVARALSHSVEERGPLLCALQEDQWFDRKDSRISPLALATAEVGFANADGGTIVVGLSNGVVEGMDAYPEQINALMQASIDFTEPPVRTENRMIPCLNKKGDPDRLLVIEVKPSTVVHANQKDEVFLRVGDENRRLNFRQRQELLYDKGQSVFEANAVPTATRRDLDDDLLQSYARALDHPDVDRLLAARSLLTHDKSLTAAAVLLFGRAPQEFFPEAYVRVLRYRGTVRGAGRRQQIVDDLRFEGPIPVILQEAANAVRALQPRRRALGGRGQFEDLPIIPEDAWLEWLVNATVHRSYSLGGDHIRVEVFDDRLEIESPGRFPGLITATNLLSATRFSRNPRITRVCSDLNFGQELGEGIRRILEEMRLAGLADPLYRETSSSVQLSLLAVAIDRDLMARLPRGSQAVIALLRREGPLGTGEIADSLGLSRPTVLRRLNALQDAGLVSWVGKASKDPRARWSVRS